jgi:hypothetical protein
VFLGVAYTTWIVLLVPPIASLLGVVYFYIRADEKEGE